MNREILIDKALSKIRLLPDTKIKEVHDFAEFLLSKLVDHMIVEGIMEITSNSRSFDFLNEEEELYNENDLKEKYK